MTNSVSSAAPVNTQSKPAETIKATEKKAPEAQGGPTTIGQNENLVKASIVNV